MDAKRQCRRILFPLGLAVIGGLGGFVLAKVTAPAIDTGPTSSQAVRQQTPSALPSAPGQWDHESEPEFEKIASAETSETLRSLWEPIADDPSIRAFAMREMIIMRWAEVDPGGGFEFFLEKWTALQKFMAEWSMRDPHAACARIVDSKRVHLVPTIVRALTRRSPERGLALLDIWLETPGLSRGAGKGATINGFARLFTADRDKAMTALEQLPQVRRLDAIRGIAESMVSADLPAARQWAESLTDPNERLAVIAKIAPELAKRDPDATIPLLAEFEEPFGWAKPGTLVVRELIKSDPDAAIAWLVRHFPAKSHEWECASAVLRHLFDHAGATGAVRAIANTESETFRGELIASLRPNAFRPEELSDAIEEQAPSPELRAKLRKPLVQSMVGTDLPTAIDYIRSLPVTESTSELWEQVFRSAGDHGFEGHGQLFWELIDELPAAKQAEHLEPRLRRLALADPRQALARLGDLQGHPGYAKLANEVASSMRFSDPERAMAWIATLDDGLRGEAARDFASGGSSENLPEMLEWMRSLGVAERHRATLAAWEFRRWANADGIAASEYVIDMEPGPVRQEAIEGLVYASYKLDPAAALEWIDQMSDATARERIRKRAEQEHLQTRRIGDE